MIVTTEAKQEKENYFIMRQTMYVGTLSVQFLSQGEIPNDIYNRNVFMADHQLTGIFFFNRCINKYIGFVVVDQTKCKQGLTCSDGDFLGNHSPAYHSQSCTHTVSQCTTNRNSKWILGV